MAWDYRVPQNKVMWFLKLTMQPNNHLMEMEKKK